MDYSLQRSWQFSDTFSWFIPDAKGRHDLKFGAQYTHTWLSNPNWGNLNGTYNFRAPTTRIRRQQSPHLSEPAARSVRPAR